MNEQQIREIAETAFKRQFPDVKLARVNVWPGLQAPVPGRSPGGRPKEHLRFQEGIVRCAQRSPSQFVGYLPVPFPRFQNDPAPAHAR